MIHSCVCLFSDSCSWVPCLFWTVKLPAVLQKNPPGPINDLVFQHFCVFEPFPTMTVWFWDPSFHTKDNWGTHLQLLQKIQTLTDAPEALNAWFFLLEHYWAFESSVKVTVHMSLYSRHFNCIYNNINIYNFIYVLYIHIYIYIYIIKYKNNKYK